MNSNFTNSSLGRILYVAIISLIVAATIFVIWYMTSGYKLGTYAPDTRLGSVYIGGLTEEEVAPRLDKKINYWYNDKTILFELEYQGYTYSFDRNLLYFDIEQSISGIQDGQLNEIAVYYQGNIRADIGNTISSLYFLENIITNVDIDELMSDMLEDASLMKSYSIKHVDDYLINSADSYEVIATTDLIYPVDFDLNELSADIEEVFEDGNILVPGEELFDIIDVFDDNMNDSQMTVLASAMLYLILDTNFIINEVHYTPTIAFDVYTIENYPYYARNTHVAKIVNESFSFYNVNMSDYMFSINVENETMSLVGLPFEYEIITQINRVQSNRSKPAHHLFVLSLYILI